MRVNVELNVNDLTRDLKFHGETNADEEVAEKVSELYVLLSSVLFSLTDLNCRVKDRDEASAKVIAEQMVRIEKGLGINLDWGDE